MDPLQAARYRTQRNDLPEDLGQPLYDRVNYATGGASNLAFFSVVQGQSATLIVNGSAATRTKDYRDTNMQNSNVIPTKMFKLSGISLCYIHGSEGTVTNPADRDKLRGSGVVRFKIVDKNILDIPLIMIPEFNPFQNVATTATTTSATPQASGGGNQGMYKFGVPITINPYENFTFNIEFTGTAVTVTTSLDILVVLHATMRRPT